MARHTHPIRRPLRRSAHNRTLVAYHEAGRVVLADWLGLPVRARAWCVDRPDPEAGGMRWRGKTAPRR